MLKTILNKTTHLLVICLLILAATIVPASSVEARYGGKADCDNNAIITCGVSGETEARQKFRSDPFVQKVFKHFSIPNEAALTGMVKGRVTKSGEIWVGNERLATGAVTAGRIKMGADEVQVPGANAWMRPPSRSFRSDSLEVLVKLNSRGEFMHGVIMSCGNPVQAAHKVQKPAPKPQPKPQPKPEQKPQPTPEPKTPDLIINKEVHGDNRWEQEGITVAPGEAVLYGVIVKNSGETDLKNVHIHDSLPTGVEFDENAALSGSDEVKNFMVGDLAGDGITIGSLKKGDSISIYFNVRILEDTDACETPLKNVAFAKADGVPEKDDDVNVTVCQPEEEPEPQVQGAQTPPEGQLPVTGAAGAVGIFSITSFLGFAAYKLKEFYLFFLR